MCVGGQIPDFCPWMAAMPSISVSRRPRWSVVPVNKIAKPACVLVCVVSLLGGRSSVRACCELAHNLCGIVYCTGILKEALTTTSKV